jgi:hypothetical protein
MCNLYSITTNQAAIAALFRVVNRYVGNLIDARDRRCQRCGAQPRLVRQILDPCTGRNICMFECKCSERS